MGGSGVRVTRGGDEGCGDGGGGVSGDGGGSEVGLATATVGWVAVAGAEGDRAAVRGGGGDDGGLHVAKASDCNDLKKSDTSCRRYRLRWGRE